MGRAQTYIGAKHGVAARLDPWTSHHSGDPHSVIIQQELVRWNPVMPQVIPMILKPMKGAKGE